MLWTKFVKAIAYITLVLGIIGSIIAAAVIASDSVALSLGVFIGGVLVSAISVSMLMVIVEISENTAACRDYLLVIKGGQKNLEKSVDSDSTSGKFEVTRKLGVTDYRSENFKATHKLRVTDYLREAPSINSNGILLLHIDSLILFRNEEGNKAFSEKPWYFVATEEKIVGWVLSDNLEKL